MKSVDGDRENPCPGCSSCRDCNTGFEKIMDIKKFGLVIYRHQIRTECVKENTDDDAIPPNITEDVFILHKTNDVCLASAEILPEMEKRDIKCPRCRHIMEHVQRILQEVPALNKNDAIGICDHCRLREQSCYKCKETVKRFFAFKKQDDDTSKERLKEWLSKIKKILEIAFGDKKESGKKQTRAHSEMQIDRICRREFGRDEHKPDIRDLLHELQRPSLARTLPMITVKLKNKINFELTNNDLGSQYEPVDQVPCDDISPAGYSRYYVHDKERDQTDIDGPYKENESKLMLGKILKHERLSLGSENKSIEGFKKYHSVEDIFSFLGDDAEMVKEDFRYAFLQKELKIQQERQKSSSELIKDTQKVKIERQNKIKEEQKKRLNQEDKDRKKLELEDNNDKIKAADKKKHLKKDIEEKRKEVQNEIKISEADDKEILEKKTATPTSPANVTIEKEQIKSKSGEIKKTHLKPGLKISKTSQKTEPDLKEYKIKGADTKIKQTESKKEDPEIKQKFSKGTPRELKPEQNQLKTEPKVTKPKAESKSEQKQQKTDTKELPKSDIKKETKSKVKQHESGDHKSELKDRPEPLNPKTGPTQHTSDSKELIRTQKKQPTTDNKLKEAGPTEIGKKQHIKENEKPDEQKKGSPKRDQPKEKQFDEKNAKDSENEKKKGEKRNVAEEKPTAKKEIDIKTHFKSPKEALIVDLIRLKKLEQDKLIKHNLKNLAQYAEKDYNKHNIRKLRKGFAETDSDFDYETEVISDIIKGDKIYKYKPSPAKEVAETEVIPLFFHKTLGDTIPEIQKIVLHLPTSETASEVGKNKKLVSADVTKGVINYALSDRQFIDKGWTMLPTEKVVRKINVYRMRPAHPEFDWFKHNKNKRLMNYDTGERLAEFEDNGRGRWYYRNGRMALDYYDAEELNAQQRFVIYSNGEPDERGRARPYTILATFDYLGNGVVFDHSGKIRLKYNQTEGIVLDRSIGPVSHWKWHSLNDPPMLQQVMIDTQVAVKDPEILKMKGAHDKKVRPENEEMLAIEFDNYIKEKSKKLSQSFKPFQIKMKALKINEHFSLKVLDQATVNLIYRDGSTNLKLNIGMILDHREIVDTDTAEVGDVSNNLERFPARTDSLAGLQKSVAYAQRFERTRTERERKLHPNQPCDSADKLTAAVSRPLRPPLLTGDSSTTTASAIKSDCYCQYRRKPSNNVYYNNRFC